LESSSGSQFDS